MNQELHSMRRRMTFYYTMILVLFTALFMSFTFYNFFRFNQFMLDRELRVNAGQVKDLNILPQLQEPIPGGKEAAKNEQHDPMFKFILRDEKLQITKSSIQYPALFQSSREAAVRTMQTQKEGWDTILLAGNEYRFFSQPFQNGSTQGVVQTCCNLTVLKKYVSRFNHILVGIGAAVILFAALTGWWLAGRAMAPLKTAWKRQKEFVADVSHELRTPLTIIQSNLDVALADWDGSIKDNMVWLQNAYGETLGMGKLINDLLLLARIDAREIQSDIQEFDLSHLLAEISLQFTPLFQSRSLNFSTSIESNVKIHGDLMRIRQMVGIFLDNAAQYTPAGGHVSLSLRRTPQMLEISVADSGIGFEESEKEKIFERFYRVDKARSRKQGGTGLGLAIAAWIINEHKGTIQVSSKPGEGSVFRVILPKS